MCSLWALSARSGRGSIWREKVFQNERGGYVQSRPQRSNIPSRPESSNANVTSAVGMEETVGHQRAKRNSLFTQTLIWISGLICSAFLLGTFAQACSNNQLVQQVQTAQQSLQQVRAKHTQLKRAA